MGVVFNYLFYFFGSLTAKLTNIIFWTMDDR